MTRQEILRLSAESECDRRTVTSYLAGDDVRAASAERIERAAMKLGIKLPGQKKGRVTT